MIEYKLQGKVDNVKVIITLESENELNDSEKDIIINEALEKFPIGKKLYNNVYEGFTIHK